MAQRSAGGNDNTMEVNYDFTEDNYQHCGVRHAAFNILGNVYCVKYRVIEKDGRDFKPL